MKGGGYYKELADQEISSLLREMEDTDDSDGPKKKDLEKYIEAQKSDDGRVFIITGLRKTRDEVIKYAGHYKDGEASNIFKVIPTEGWSILGYLDDIYASESVSGYYKELADQEISSLLREMEDSVSGRTNKNRFRELYRSTKNRRWESVYYYGIT